CPTGAFVTSSSFSGSTPPLCRVKACRISWCISASVVFSPTNTAQAMPPENTAARTLVTHITVDPQDRVRRRRRSTSSIRLSNGVSSSSGTTWAPFDSNLGAAPGGGGGWVLGGILTRSRGAAMPREYQRWIRCVCRLDAVLVAYHAAMGSWTPRRWRGKRWGAGAWRPVLIDADE